MANPIMSLYKRRALSLVCSALKSNNLLPISGVQNVRTLYSRATLGLDGFELQQNKTRNQMLNIADKFREKMIEYSNVESQSMVFTEDLKNMIHLTENDDDVELVVNMLKKYNSQNKQVRFGNYVFGPVVMRMLYYFGKDQIALELFQNPEFTGFFDQVITYQILMDMLYEKARYQDILNVFNEVKERQLEGAKYPRNAVVLALAACYKLNSKESLEYTVKLWKELSETGHLPMRRATTFAAGLALNQGEPAIALEILASSRNQNYMTVRSLKASALSDLGRVEDAIPILKSILTDDTSNQVPTINKDVIEKVKSAVLKLDSPDTTLEFNRIEQILSKQGSICDESLDAQLCSEIQKPPMMNNRERNQGNLQYRNQRNFKPKGRSFTYSQRPGLTDLV